MHIVWKAGKELTNRLRTSSRILRGSPRVFVLSRNFAVTYALFGYFWVTLPDFCHFWDNFVHFLIALFSKFLVNRSDAQWEV